MFYNCSTVVTYNITVVVVVSIILEVMLYCKNCSISFVRTNSSNKLDILYILVVKIFTESETVPNRLRPVQFRHFNPSLTKHKQLHNTFICTNTSHTTPYHTTSHYILSLIGFTLRSRPYVL